MSSLLLLSSCNSAYRVKDAYQLSKCKYTFKNVSNIVVAEIDLSQGLSLGNITKLTALLNGGLKSLPVEMVVNMNIENPTSSKAALTRMDYKVALAGEHVADGSTVEAISIAPMQSGSLPMRVRFDAISLLEGKSGTAAIGVIKNLLGVGSEPIALNLQLKPYFKIGNADVGMPGYVPINVDIKNKEK